MEYKTSVLDSQTWTRMKNMVATSWSRDKERRWFNGRSRRSTKWCTAKPVNRTSYVHHHNVEPRRQCFENILMLLMMEIRGFDQVSSSELHKCHRGVPVRRHQRSKWLKELRKRYPCAPLEWEEIWSRDRNKIRTRCPIIFWLRPYAFQIARNLVIS
jgi:hypothetical protein